MYVDVTRYPAYIPTLLSKAQFIQLPKGACHPVTLAADCHCVGICFFSSLCLPFSPPVSAVLASLGPDSIPLILNSDWDIDAALLPHFSEVALTLK